MEPFHEHTSYANYLQDKLNAPYEDWQHYRQWRAAYERDQNEAYLPYLDAAYEKAVESETISDLVRTSYRYNGPDPRYPAERVFWERKIKADMQ